MVRVSCGCNSVGRVSASQAEGRGFESRHPLNKNLPLLHGSDNNHSLFQTCRIIFFATKLKHRRKI